MRCHETPEPSCWVGVVLPIRRGICINSTALELIDLLTALFPPMQHDELSNSCCAHAMQAPAIAICTAVQNGTCEHQTFAHSAVDLQTYCDRTVEFRRVDTMDQDSRPQLIQFEVLVMHIGEALKEF